MTFPTNALEFQKQFSSEEQCESALLKLRWPRGFVCPNCGHDDGYQLEARRQIQCCVCRYQASVTAGTIFHKTHLPLTCWFRIIYEVAQDKGGVSATSLASQLGRPYKTIWHVLHKVRHAMGRRDEKISLAGLIEMDEAKLGPEARRPAKDNPEDKKRPRKKPYGKPSSRRGAKRKTIVEVLILTEAERFHTGNVAMKGLDALGFHSIREFIEKRAEPGQWYRTDAHHSHWVLRHLSPNFQITKSDEAEGPERLPCVHRVINLLKHLLMGTYFGVSAKYLPGYLNEFCFRFIRREKQELIAQSLLQACLFALPMTYAELKL
jgi:ISXO2-like transposase domain/Transposase zinc-ribbon domain